MPSYAFSQTESDPSYQIYAYCLDETAIEITTVYEYPNGRIERNGENLGNSAEEYIYRDFDAFQLECAISDFFIRTEFEKREPRMRGPAGFLPTGRITLELDGNPIISNANFLIGPSEYLTSVRVSAYYENRIDIEICGTSSFGWTPSFNGCMAFDLKRFVSQSSGSPISDWVLSEFGK